VADSDFLWWRDGVIYHIYLRSFADSDGDGLGDLPGLIAHLDHLNGSEDSLGVDAIWISPFYPSPDKDFGYDVADYTNIDPRYGTLADFDRLVQAAHQRGIRVMLDLVFNHTSDQHAWFLESRASRSNPKSDWYVWRDPAPRGAPPNNWLSIFGGEGWEWVDERQQFYFHMFLKQQPDLNWRNPAVRQELMDAVRFWLDRGADGFRLDVFSAWYKHASLPDNPPCLGLRAFDRQRHIHDVNQPEMSDALSEFRRILDSYPARAAVGEPFGSSLQAAARHCGDDQLQMVFNFEFTGRRWSPAAFLRAIQRQEEALETKGWPCYVLSNHDMPRAITRYGGRHADSVAKVAATLLLTLRGTPFVYYGEEIALPDTPLRRSQLVDPASRRYYPFFNRDGARCPMPWDASPSGGFTAGKPWLPLHPAHLSRNVAAQRQDPNSAFGYYRTLLRLRRQSIALRRGSFQPLTQRPRAGLAYLRQTETESALVALNFSPGPIRLVLDSDLPGSRWELAISSLSEPTARASARAIALGAHEAAVFFGR
jgi:alpha-glucosidase